MSTDKHPAEVLAEKIARFGAHDVSWCVQAAAMLRRIPALEDQRDAANQVANGVHAMLCTEVEKVKALEAEIARLRADLDDAQAAESVAILAVESLRADAERLDWLQRAATEGKIELARSILKTGYEIGEWPSMKVTVRHGDLRAAIDAAREAHNGNDTRG